MTVWHWSPEELQWLERHAELMTPQELHRHFNAVGSDKGWPRRSYHGLKNVCEKRGLSRRTQRQIVNLDTGEVYPSVAAAARELWCSTSSIYLAISRGSRCCGYRWGYLNELEETYAANL